MSADVWRALQQLKYKQRVLQFYIKPTKTYHHPSSPYISQVQVGGYFFKNPEVVKKFSFPDKTEKEAYLNERRNWRFVSIPKGEKDSQGQKVLECPQDSVIVKDLLKKVCC
jgi:hypothetical protein